MYNESTFYRRYGFETYVFFLCSYHAYNRCDGAGVESVNLQKAAAKQRKGWRYAFEYSYGINMSTYHNSVGFTFPKIRRDHHVFPIKLLQKKNKDKDSWQLRQRCEVRFFWYEDGIKLREDGVILVRYVPVSLPLSFWNRKPQLVSTAPGDGELFEVLDMRLEPPGGLLCEKCSKSNQKPMRHLPNSPDCAHASKGSVSSRVKSNCLSVPGPDPERIGPEAAAYKLDVANRKRPKGTHPCKLITPEGDPCSFHYLTKTWQPTSTCNPTITTSSTGMIVCT